MVETKEKRKEKKRKEMSIRTQRNGYRRWFLKLLRRQSSGGYWFNPDCRRVTIKE